MLSLVAGPFPIDRQSPATDEAFEPEDERSLFLDGWGLVTLQGNTSASSDDFGSPYIVTPDGKAMRVGVSHNHRSLGYDPIQKCLVVASGGAPVTWYRSTFPALGQVDPTWEPPTLSDLGAANAFGVMADRVLICTDGRTIDAAPFGEGFDTEYSYDGTDISGASGMWYAGEEDGNHFWWIWTSSSPCIVWKYNATTQTKVPGSESALGATFTCGGYSVKHGLFFIVREAAEEGEYELFVYSDEPVADSISAPTLAGVVKRGGVQSLSVTVTGEHDEPCPGRNVTFEVDAGSCSPEVVTTDVDGVATTLFLAPLTAGSVEATATLEE